MEKKQSRGLIVLVVILILIVLGLGGYLVYDKVLSKEEPKNEQIQEEPQEEQEKLSVLEVEELLKTLPDSFYYDKQDVWNGQLVTIDNIDHKVLLSKAHDYIIESNDKITTETLQNKIKELYNITEIKHQDFLGYKYENGEYTTQRGIGGPGMVTMTKLIDYNIDKGVLSINEKVGFSTCGADCYITTKQTYNESDILKKIEITEDLNINDSTEYFENNLDKFTTYKHIFKKASDGKYYWYSSEIVNE